MGLTSVIQSAVAAGFDAAGDLKKTAKFTNVTASSYNATTGTVTESTTDYTGIEGIRREYTQEELAHGIAQSGDISFVVEQADISFDVKTIDRITIDDIVYQIKEIRPDPVDVVYRLRVRAAYIQTSETEIVTFQGEPITIQSQTVTM